MRNWIAAFAIAAGAMLCGAPLLADDSAMTSIGGGMVSPMTSHPSVRMVSEVVSIRLTGDQAKVHCVFVFRNEGKRCTVKMGFPEESKAGGEGGLQKLDGFRSSVDGKPVRCIYKSGKQKHEARSSDINRNSWYVKDVPFGSGQTRTVVDEYSTGLSSESNSMQTWWEIPLNFTYILCTGRNWKGPIGKATIAVDISGVPQDHYEIKPGPSGFVRAKSAISWSLSNFEPIEDISIDLIPRFPKLNGKIVDPDLWTPFTREHGITMTGTGFLDGDGAEIRLPDEDNNFYMITYGKHTLRLTLGSKTALLDGKNVTLQAAPSKEYYPGQVPTADVVRALGGKAHYSPQEHRLLIWMK